MKFLPYILKQCILFIGFLLIGAAAQTQVGPVNIGTLPKGKSIKIVYDATINTDLPAGTTQISHQGTVSGSNFSNVLTDDPDAGGATDPTITILDVPPYMVSINRQTPSVQLTNATAVTFRATFSELVTGVSTDDFELFQVSGSTTGTISSVTPFGVDGTTYDVLVNTISGDGEIRLDLKASGTGIVDDGNTAITGGFSTGQTYIIDQTVPTLSPVTIASNNANPAYAKVGDVVTLSFTASEAVGTPTVTIATHSVVPVAGTGNSYTATYTMLSTDAEGLVPFTIDFTDGAGNAGTQVTATTNSSSVTFDKTVPSVTINQASTQADPTSNTTIHFTAVFSEAVSGFTNTDVTLSGTAGATTVVVTEIAPNNGTTYDVAVTGMTVDGTVIAALPANAASDPAGNLSTASTSIDNTVTYIVDAPPTILSINRHTPLVSLTNATSVTFRATFSEDVTGVDASDFSLALPVSGLTASIGTVSGSGSVYDVQVNSISGNGTLGLNLNGSGTGIKDAINQDITGGLTGQTYTIDQVAPTVAGSVRKTPLAAATNATSVTYTVTFSEDVTGVDAADFSLTATGTVAGTIGTISGSGATYDVQVNSITGDGTLRLDVKASGTGISDGATNGLSGGFTTGETYTFDHTAPTVVSINRFNPSTQGTTATTLVWRVTFSETVSGVDISDFILATTGTATGTISTVSASSGTVIDVTVTGVSGTGGNTIGLNLKSSGTGIVDDVTNAISGGFTGQTYTIGIPPEFTVCPTTKSFNTDLNQCYATVSLATLLSGLTATGTPAPTLTVKVGATVVTTSYQFPLGNTMVDVTASNGVSPDAVCSYTVTVSDNQAPSITGISVSDAILWPPNHKMRTVTVNYTATDNCVNPVTTSLSVSSNEPVNGTGDGDTDPDWIVDDNHQVQLRAERANNSPGRIYTITITASDGTNTSTQTVTVTVAHNITAPLSGTSFKLGSTVAFSGVFWDKPGNRHTANWLIDGSTTVKGTVTEPSGNKNGKVTGSYKFGAAGVYKLQMNITDQNRVTSYVNTNEDLEAIVVIYDPNGGYTYGGGHFASPAGALTGNPTATGKVSYGFAVNYFKGATLPKGETQFEFKVGELEYNALNFDYLAIQGARAQFKGSGKIIGGQSGIDFTMTVIDGALDGTGVDKVRIKIHNKNTGFVYYDNEPALSEADNPTTKVGLGSQVVIKGTAVPTTNAVTRTESLREAMDLELRVLPNPTRGDFSVFVSSDNSRDKIELQVFDLYGRKVEERTVSGELTRLGATYRPGTYLIRIVQGNKQRDAKLLKLPD